MEISRKFGCKLQDAATAGVIEHKAGLRGEQGPGIKTLACKVSEGKNAKAEGIDLDKV